MLAPATRCIAFVRPASAVVTAGCRAVAATWPVSARPSSAVDRRSAERCGAEPTRRRFAALYTKHTARVRSKAPGADLPAHHNPEGGFRNPWPSFRDHGPADIANMLREWDRSSKQEPLPRVPIDTAALASPPADGSVQITWIGHATFLVQLDGITFLTDPMFSERASALQIVGPKRFTPPACAVSDLPPVDFVLLSHNHYDHLDSGSVRALLSHGTKTFVTALGVGDTLHELGVHDVVELDWWESHPIDCGGGRTGTATLTPGQHHSGRTLWDRFQTLWGGFAVRGGGGRNFYFSGDTGYRSVPKGVKQGDAVAEARYPACPAFKEIGERLGPFDVAALPIGAYSPRWFMSSVHAAPHEAVLMHADVRAKNSVAMHWGTFPLTDESTDEPPRLLREAADAAGIGADKFATMDVGETRVY